MKNVLLTGAAGFIGSSLTRALLAMPGDIRVTALDALTYAGDIENLPERGPRLTFHHGDIADGPLVRGLFTEFSIDTVINCAAETHVDKSIHDPGIFLKTNVMGTGILLEESRRAWGNDPMGRRFHQISTDEVYGSLEPGDPPFTEKHPYDPSSPYSASKAAADHWIRAYGRTYGLPISISNCSNNYGPRQYPEKLLPVAILSCLEGKPIPVYGDGLQRRDWLHVEDHCRGIIDVITIGLAGETYNLGGGWETSNLEILEEVCRIMDHIYPISAPHHRLLSFVKDRPGHDRRYAIDARKARQDLGWVPLKVGRDGIAHTVQWYLHHRGWIDRMREKASYQTWVKANYESRTHA